MRATGSSIRAIPCGGSRPSSRRRCSPSLPQGRPFSRLIPPQLASINLAYLKEIDVLQSRRQETRTKKPGQSSGKGEEESPSPKRRPKFPKKPRQTAMKMTPLRKEFTSSSKTSWSACDLQKDLLGEPPDPTCAEPTGDGGLPSRPLSSPFGPGVGKGSFTSEPPSRPKDGLSGSRARQSFRRAQFSFMVYPS